MRWSLPVLSLICLLLVQTHVKGKVQEKSAPPLIVSLIGTNDLHGHMDRLPLLAGYVNNLRQQRRADGGGVLLVDAGDMFQGTLASNLSEGAAVITLYNAMGYAATAVGNHEFDFGPVGPDVTVIRSDQRPIGALLARARQARFPLLAGNIVNRVTGRRVQWPKMPASVLHEVAGVKTGIIGITTVTTPTTTMPANVKGLRFIDPVPVIIREAAGLRRRGAKLILVAAHAGAACTDFRNPEDLSSCGRPAEILQIAEALPPGTVDAMVAGHVHSFIAHRPGGIPVIESSSYGRAFGRIDFHLDRRTHQLRSVQIHQPRWLCGDRRATPQQCRPGSYAGKSVEPDPAIAALLQKAEARAEKARQRPLGVTIVRPVRRSRDHESALGNLFADLMLQARPAADFSLRNSGGLRADLPAGPLTYGTFYEAMPFDNRFALATVTGAGLQEVIRTNLQGRHSLLSFSGIRVRAACAQGRLEVEVHRADGRPVGPADKLLMVTSNYLATGGEAALRTIDKDRFRVESSPLIREAMVRLLEKRGGKLSGSDKSLLDPQNPRYIWPGGRPVACP